MILGKPANLRLAALVIAALVGDNDAKTGDGEPRDLTAPAIPKFRIAM
jgi:hypothetical protein